MARLCAVCGRSGLAGHTRSHSNIASKRVRKLNLQTVRIDGKRQRACANCVRSEVNKYKKAATVA